MYTIVCSHRNERALARLAQRLDLDRAAACTVKVERTVHPVREGELVDRGRERIAFHERRRDLQAVVALLTRELFALDVAELAAWRFVRPANGPSVADYPVVPLTDEDSRSKSAREKGMRRGGWRCAHAALRLPQSSSSHATGPAPTLTRGVAPSLAASASSICDLQRIRWFSRAAAHTASVHSEQHREHDGSHRMMQRRLRHIPISSATPSTAQQKKQKKTQNHKSKPHQQQQVRLRLADQHVTALVTKRTSPAEFVTACRQLSMKDEIKILAGTDLQAWNIALQNRLVQDDVDGARALLELVGNFDVANTNEQLWTDLLFTLMRQHSSLSDGNEVKRILDELHAKCGKEFVAQLLVSVVNGCANIKMFDQAQFLVLYHLELSASVTRIPSRIIGHLVSNMAAKRRYTDVIAFTTDLFKHPRFELADFQQQGFIALFRSCTLGNEPPNRSIAFFLKWFEAKVAQLNGENGDFKQKLKAQQFEKVFGAAIQCCVETPEGAKLALRCYDAMVQLNEEGNERVILIDENIYVNVLKACVAQSDPSLFKDVYRSMVGDGVARGPGFGSAIRFCTTTRDISFLEEVLEDAFALEDALQGAWMLDVPQYNDALGCFAATKSYDLAKDLFSRMLQNPFITPDHITMLEVVENHRDAPFADLFNLMELFLEWDLCPNLQVFTSLLATCARRRLVGDAMALLDAMKTQGVEPDVKTFTVIAFVYGTHADIGGIVRILKTMAVKKIETDQVFFDYVMNALHGASGIDICFSLFREMREADLAIPEGLYGSLVDVGTKVGLVERTLHIAYEMECDGFTLSSERMQALVARCESSTELNELIRTFVLLHQGYQDAETARFTVEVYEELIELLARFSKRDMIPKIRKLAEDAGLELQ